jgi:7,8-dihydropterin-6-yl-methyl-4-(beta-D-ribofuranosyl)aminobenzene 5'-phosphate synthase
VKITILCENQVSYRGRKTLLAEWGFSAWLETNKHKILFDTGHTKVYIHNAEKLNINLETADYIALSHHHWDHCGGLQHHPFKTRKKLIMHPELPAKLPHNEAENVKRDFELILSRQPLQFAENIWFLGEIPRKIHFEKGTYNNQPIPDDTALAIKTASGIVVLTGCSHSGVCNICEQAKVVTGEKIYAVIGGFHLFETNREAVDGTIAYFQMENIQKLYPMHCVDFPTLSKMRNILGVEKLGAGDGIILDE